MTVLSPIIEMATDLLAVDIADLLHRCAVGPQPVGDDLDRAAALNKTIQAEASATTKDDNQNQGEI